MCSLPFSPFWQPSCAMHAACAWQLLWQQVFAAEPCSLHLQGLSTAYLTYELHKFAQRVLAVCPTRHTCCITGFAAADLHSRAWQCPPTAHVTAAYVTIILQQALAALAPHSCCLLHRPCGRCPVAGRQAHIACTFPCTLGGVKR